MYPPLFREGLCWPLEIAMKSAAGRREGQWGRCGIKKGQNTEEENVNIDTPIHLPILSFFDRIPQRVAYAMKKRVRCFSNKVVTLIVGDTFGVSWCLQSILDPTAVYFIIHDLWQYTHLNESEVFASLPVLALDQTVVVIFRCWRADNFPTRTLTRHQTFWIFRLLQARSCVNG